MAASRITICFDGSDGAVDAVAAAARIFPHAHATIAYVWRKPIPNGGPSWGGTLIVPPELRRELERDAAERAQEVVDDGVALARSYGLESDGRSFESAGPVWRELLAAADETEADVLIAGSRGFGEVRALLLGSTSQALAHHARRPFLIIPASEEE